MPTYRNDSNRTICIDSGGYRASQSVKQGAVIAVDYYASAAGLTLVSAAPLVRSPVLMSASATNETVSIPFSRMVTISVKSASGATIYFADDTVGVQLAAGESGHVTGFWSRLAKIRVVGTATIIVEEAN